MLKRLKRDFVLLCAGLTGLVLLAACLLAFSLTKTQIERANLEAFEYQSQTLSVLLAGSKQLNHSQIYRMEKDGDVLIWLFDNGNPIRIAGAEDEGRRETLFGAALAQLAAKSGGEPVEPAQRSAQPVNLSTDFSHGGDAFLAKYISTPIGAREWYSMVLVKPIAGQSQDVHRTALLYAGIFAAGLALLFVIARLLAGRSLRPVEAAQAKQKEFIAAASHELKSPLAVIASSVDILQNAKGDAAACCQNIRGEARRMSGLVDDLLLLAGAETGKWTVKKAATNVEDVLAAAYERYLPLATQKEVSLRLNLPGGSLPLVPADEERLLQVLSVLLSNAISYSPAGSQVTIEGGREKKAVALSVRDNGPGIANEDKANIFDSFYRARQPHSDKSHFGLGLAVAQQLVLLHDGTLAVEDTPGGGATFVVKLKCAL